MGEAGEGPRPTQRRGRAKSASLRLDPPEDAVRLRSTKNGRRSAVT